MKIEELRKALKVLIREEVKKAVAEEVSRAMGKVLVEMVKEIKSNNPPTGVIKERKDYVGQEIEEEPSTQEMPILQTKNPKLNGVLAETARHFRPLPKPSTSGLVELMGGGFDKIGKGQNTGITEPATKLDFLKQMVAQTANDQPSALDGGAEVPDMLKKVFKKDFRAVMQKMNEQKNGQGNTGYFDPTKVLSG